MAKKVDVSGYERFSDVNGPLDKIIAAVRDKDTSLERSLDLLDEAIALGTRAVDLVDKAAFSPDERERMADVDPAPGAREGAVAEGPGEGEGAQGEAADASGFPDAGAPATGQR